MRVQYSEAWGGWQAQEVINGELVTIINRESRDRAINSLLAIIYEKQDISGVEREIQF